MEAVATAIPDVLILTPRVFGDPRGFFLESFNRDGFRKVTGLDVDFVQDNHSRSGQAVLRGLHYQMEHTQGKLVRVTQGRVFDVAVDVRQSSPTFGKWVGTELSDTNFRQLWVPPGFAHGFLVLSETADFQYKTTDFYHPASEQCLRWDDPEVGIDWPLHELSMPPALAERDRNAPLLRQAKLFP